MNRPHQKVFNQFVLVAFMVGVLFSGAAFAERILINATIGDKISYFSIFPERDDFVLEYRSSNERRNIRIGKKNFNFALTSANEILRLGKVQKPKASSCWRDLATIELIKNSKSTAKASMCLMSGDSQSKALLNLLNVIAMDITGNR